MPRLPFATIERVARSFDFGKIFCGPHPDAAERLAQAQPEVSQPIFDFWRDYRMDRPHDQAIALHLTQRLRQHFLADTVNPSPEFGKAQLFAVRELLNDKHRPFISDAANELCHERFDLRIDFIGF